MASWAARNPLTLAVVTGGTKNCVCDFLVQAASSQDHKIDWRRNGVFTAFGFLYVGAAQHAIFNHLFPRLLPGLAKRSLSSVGAASLLDNFVHIPFVYLPVFYCIREVAHSEGTSSLPQAFAIPNPVDSVGTGVQGKTAKAV